MSKMIIAVLVSWLLVSSFSVFDVSFAARELSLLLLMMVSKPSTI
jgi:hypothetical protein